METNQYLKKPICFGHCSNVPFGGSGCSQKSHHSGDSHMRHVITPVSMGDLQDPIDGGTSVLYHIFGHMNCGDIPLNLGLKNRPYIC